jgi:hypothetical protein|tara:strand:+ start:568 stop:1077 length:510 start_codon:yes stop_codon:yes gene_type:complete
MRKIILVSITTLIFIGCNQKLNEKCDSIVKENAQIEKNIKSYKTAWNAFFETRNSKAINTDSFNEQATVVTASGNITGIEAFRDYYNNYLTGFSDAEFTFIDVFGQGDKIVKHWNFKGTHDGEMFGIPATNKKVDISGTTLVLMKDGKVLQEQDYFDNHSFLMQLGLLE